MLCHPESPNLVLGRPEPLDVNTLDKFFTADEKLQRDPGICKHTPREFLAGFLTDWRALFPSFGCHQHQP